MFSLVSFENVLHTCCTIVAQAHATVVVIVAELVNFTRYSNTKTTVVYTCCTIIAQAHATVVVIVAELVNFTRYSYTKTTVVFF